MHAHSFFALCHDLRRLYPGTSKPASFSFPVSLKPQHTCPPAEGGKHCIRTLSNRNTTCSLRYISATILYPNIIIQQHGSQQHHNLGNENQIKKTEILHEKYCLLILIASYHKIRRIIPELNINASMYCPLVSAGALRDRIHDYLGKSYFTIVSFYCSLICLLASQPELTISLSILPVIN